jgi:hypothetical protein
MHIQEGRAAVSQLLDGDAVASEAGWNCVTFDAGEVSRVLWVSRNVAASMHDALWIARRQGVLASKLAEMQPLQAKIAHLTTLARPEPQN